MYCAGVCPEFKPHLSPGVVDVAGKAYVPSPDLLARQLDLYRGYPCSPGRLAAQCCVSLGYPRIDLLGTSWQGNIDSCICDPPCRTGVLHGWAVNCDAEMRMKPANRRRTGMHEKCSRYLQLAQIEWHRRSSQFSGEIWRVSLDAHTISRFREASSVHFQGFPRVYQLMCTQKSKSYTSWIAELSDQDT